MHDLFILLTQFKRVVKSDICDVQGDRKVSVETFEANMCFLGKNMLNQCFCQLCGLFWINNITKGFSLSEN